MIKMEAEARDGAQPAASDAADTAPLQRWGRSVFMTRDKKRILFAAHLETAPFLRTASGGLHLKAGDCYSCSVCCRNRAPSGAHTVAVALKHSEKPQGNVDS